MNVKRGSLPLWKEVFVNKVTRKMSEPNYDWLEKCKLRSYRCYKLCFFILFYLFCIGSKYYPLYFVLVNTLCSFIRLRDHKKRVKL